MPTAVGAPATHQSAEIDLVAAWSPDRAPTGESPRFRVVWERRTIYEEDKCFFNPFGRWRFAELV